MLFFLQSALSKSSGAEVAGSDTSEDEGGSTIGVSYKSRGAIPREGPSDQGATAVIETETEVGKDAQAIFEKSLAINKASQNTGEPVGSIVATIFFTGKSDMSFLC